VLGCWGVNYTKAIYVQGNKDKYSTKTWYRPGGLCFNQGSEKGTEEEHGRDRM